MIWVIGHGGMLGSEVCAALLDEGLPFMGSGRETDIRDPEALEAKASKQSIDFIVNCAAYTAVERAEQEQDIAEGVNAKGAGNVARLAERIGARLIHVSSDYVFDGRGSRPYEETDPVNPVGVYGKSKAGGEEAVRRECGRHFIVRTSWLYGKHGNNFIHTMLRLMSERDEIGVVADQCGTPTWTKDLAAMFLRILASKSVDFGIYHFSGEGSTTWFEFAARIQEEAFDAGLLKRKIRINPLTTDQYPSAVRRPMYSVLSKDKTKRVFGVTIADWKDSLRLYVQDLNGGCRPGNRVP